MSDTEFIREVEEEVRREKIKKFWDQFGAYILVAAFAIVATVSGLKFYEYWSKSRAETAGAAFVSADALVEEGKLQEARAEFEKLAKSGPGGYTTLAQLRLAAGAAANGKTDEAVAAYDLVAKQSSDKLLKGLASISAAMLRVDEAEFSEMKDRLGSFVALDNAWRHSARELLGLSAYRAKSYDEARSYFNELLADRDAPQNLRQRAEMMLSLIFGASGGDIDEESSSDVQAEEDVGKTGKAK